MPPAVQTMTRQPLHDWCGQALVVGGGGIGRALVPALERLAPGLQVHLATRNPRGSGEIRLDLCDDDSLAALAQHVSQQFSPLRLVINTAGLLHGPRLQPEKRLSAVTRAQLRESFELNAYGPILLARSLESALPRELPSHFASLSARVGSIGDNRLGGWYAYRAAKAAQNQLLRTLALEWRRRLPLATVTLLHPGTTATGLSEPFRAGVPPERLFNPERAALQLLRVLDGQTPERSGAFLAWDGQPIPW
jgi:NAD(P)-dependent dehydrogenase (short-subunit alcohol dehydrogenase family)